MRNLSGMEYLKIDIANRFGFSKVTWDARLEWTDYHEKHLEDMALMVPETSRVFFNKAVRAYRQAQKGEDIGHIVYLDATASGPQILAALSGCMETAFATNMVNPDNREDIYDMFTTEVNQQLDPEDRLDTKYLKYCLMPHFYGKVKQDLNPKQNKVFYEVLDRMFPGPQKVMEIGNLFWNWNARDHTFKMPDGCVVYIPVDHMVNTTIEVDELDHTTFMYRYKANLSDNERPEEAAPRKTSLIPNIIQALDGHIAKQVIRSCRKKNIPVLPVFDEFGFHPNYGNEVRMAYMEAMAEIAREDTLENILKQLGPCRHLNKLSYKLPACIMNSEYMLS